MTYTDILAPTVSWRAEPPPVRAERRLRTPEVRLLAALATGAPVTAVADRLEISDRTVRRRIRLVCDKIGVDTPIEAVAWAARRRII